MSVPGDNIIGAIASVIVPIIRIRMTPQNSMVEQDSRGGYVLNRTMFHEALKSALFDWITKMRRGDDGLRDKMRRRMDELIDKHFAV